jgi:steroid delta-isomerase-like uncharacterized protein
VTAVLGNLRLRFLLMVLLAMVPAVGLLYLNAAEQRDAAVEEAREDARRLASLAAGDHRRVIESTRDLLTALSQMPGIQAMDATACGTLLADLLAQLPLYANLGVISADGQLACSAIPVSGSVNLSDRAYFRATIQTRDFTIGEYQIGRVTNVASLNSGYPIFDENDKLIGVVYAALDLAQFKRFAATARLPEGSVLTVYDQRGTILVREPDAGNLAGHSALGTPAIATAVAAPIAGTRLADVADEDGTAFLYAFAPLVDSATGDAMVSVAIPRASAEEAADQAFGRSLTRLGLVILVILVAAWVGGDLLVRRDSEANKALVRHLYNAFDTGGVDLLDEIVAPDFIDHNPIPGQAPHLAGLKQVVGLFRAAFPDGAITIETMVAEADRVVTHVRMQGTQMGAFAGTPASGREVQAEGSEMYRIHGGKIVEGWSRFGSLEPVSSETRTLEQREGPMAKEGEDTQAPSLGGGADGAQH